MLVRICAAGLMALVLGSPPSQAEGQERAETRVAALETRLAGLFDNLGLAGQRPVARAQASPVGELSLRLDTAEAQMRQLTGEVERLSYQMRQLQEQLRRLSGDAEVPPPEAAGRPRAAAPAPRGPDAVDLAAQQPTRPMSQPGAPVQAVPGAPPRDIGQLVLPADRAGRPLDLNAPVGAPSYPPAAAGTQTAVLAPTATPKDEYDLAYGYILRGDFELAEASFRQFLAAYPQDRLAGNAQFWLGESYFRRQRWREAADAFLKAYTEHGEGAKAPDSLARLGMALRALSETEAACATFVEFGRRFPRASADLKRQVQAEQKRAAC